MKRISGFIGSLSLLLLAFPPVALAANVISCPSDAAKGGQFNPLCNLTTDNLGSTLGTIITFAFIGATIIALAFLIYGGVKWTVSGGDKTAIEEARNHVISAVVGLVIVFLAFFIINIVVFLFTKQSLMNLQLPTLAP